MKTFVVNWTGPYSKDDLDDNKSGLYLITGYEKHKKTKLSCYCGITNNLGQRLGNYHHKADRITQVREYWLGKFVNCRNTTKNLKIVEKLIVYFWQDNLNLNDLLKKRIPEPTTVISRWFNQDEDIRHNISHEAQKLDDVILWDGKYWYTGNLRIFEEE